MEFATSTEAGVHIFSLSGRFDAFAAPRVAEELVRLAEQPARLVVDLVGVDFIDSTGLATLVQAMKHCREQGGELVLCGLQEPVRVIFELTRLDRAFEIVADRAAAMSAVIG